ELSSGVHYGSEVHYVALLFTLFAHSSYPSARSRAHLEVHYPDRALPLLLGRAAALNSVSEHGVEPLLREKEPLQRLARVGRKPECLGATWMHHDPQWLEADGK